MKARWLSISVTALMIISAGLALNTETPTTEAMAIEEPTPEALAKKSGCFECHSVDKKVTGPAFHDIAVRYKDDSQARKTLI